MKHLLTGCPLCGEKIYVEDLMQYGIRRFIKGNGEESKTQKRIDYGSTNSSLIYCLNPECEFRTNEDWEQLGGTIKIFTTEDGKYYWEDSNEEDE